jgi:Glycosyltransferase 61
MPLKQLLSRTSAATALKLRRLQWVHRPAKWVKDGLLRAGIEGGLEFSRWLWKGHLRFGPPHGTFSAYQALRTGSPPTPGRIVLQDQGSPVVSEDSILVTGGYRQHLEQPWPIFWSAHPHARLAGESLALLSADKRLCLESVYGHERLRGDPAARWFRLPPSVRLAGNWTSLVSRWVPATESVLPYPNYTHWLLDALPRLALLPEFPADTGILVPSRLHPNEKEALALLGLLPRCRFTPERHLEIEKYYFSSPTAMLQGYNPYAIQFLRQTFLPLRDRSFSGPKRFFIQRRSLTREPLNRVAIEQLFTDAGWTVIDIMPLSFAQQIQLFAEAEAVAGMFGSGFTNCVFCQPGCAVMPIMPTDFGLDSFLEWIAQVVPYRSRPLIVPGAYNFQFAVDLAAIRQWLASNPV